MHVSALHCHILGQFLVPSERCSIEKQSIEYCGWVCCVWTNKYTNYKFSLLIMYGSFCMFRHYMRSAHHVTRHNTPIHNILSTVSQLSIPQKALETLRYIYIYNTYIHCVRRSLFNFPTPPLLFPFSWKCLPIAF